MDPNSEEENKAIQSDEIVEHLLQVRSERESSTIREKKVVVDEQGNKIIRVRKRKRVYSEKQPDKKPSVKIKKSFVTFAISILVLLVILGAIGIFRVSSYNSPEFAASKEREMSQLWGCKVKIDRIRVEGFSFSVDSLTAEFPETSIIKEIRFNRLGGGIEPISLLTGVFRGEQFQADNVRVILRNNVKEVQVPVANGSDLWSFNRFYTPKLVVEFEDKAKGPFFLSGEAYLRKVTLEKHMLLLQGKVFLRGWDPININISTPTVSVSKSGLDMVNVDGVIGGDNSRIRLEGSMPNGSPVYATELEMQGGDVMLSYLTGGVFKKIFDGCLGVEAKSDKNSFHVKVSLPTQEMTLPPMKGSLEHFSRINFQSRPIFQEVSRILNTPAFRSPRFQSGKVDLVSDGNNIELQGINFEERNLMKMYGNLTAVIGGDISGNLTFSLPSDGAVVYETLKIDPIFTEKGSNAEIKLEISGNVSDPQDNAKELISAANEKRRTTDTVRLLSDSDKAKAREEVNSENGNSNAPAPAAGDDSENPFASPNNDKTPETPAGGASSSSEQFDDLLR